MPNSAIRLRASAITHQGRVRQNNEDSVDLWLGEYFLVGVVADGMGGAAAGEEASRLAIEAIRARLSEGISSPDAYADFEEAALGALLRQSVEEANDKIFSSAQANPDFGGMGTTLTLAFARQNHITLAHVGDSRAYRIDGQDGAIEQVTIDHSFVQALVEAGHIRAEDADDHPMSNVLYRALGQGHDIEVDLYQGVHLHIGDRLVLCSDGLTLHVKPIEIADIALASKDTDLIAQNLVDLALERGGRDNVTVVVIMVDYDNEAMMALMDGAEDAHDETIPMPHHLSGYDDIHAEGEAPDGDHEAGA